MSTRRSQISCLAWAVFCSGIDSPVCVSPVKRDCELFLASIPSQSPVKRRLSLRRVDISLSDQVKSR